MKQLITVTIDSPSSEALKSDSGTIYRGIAEALSKTNGSEVRINMQSADNTKAIRFFLLTEVMSWAAGEKSRKRPKRNIRKRGWLARAIGDAKDQFMDGLTK